MPPKKNNLEGIIIEYVTVGGSMKVTALDPKTLLEATIIAPISSTPREAAALAVRKLRYLKEKGKSPP
jgi:hypothetical protein